MNNIKKKVIKIYNKIKKYKHLAVKYYHKKLDFSKKILIKVKKVKIKIKEKNQILNFLKRIFHFHKKQKKNNGLKTWFLKDKYFSKIGQIRKSIDKVLIYVPGGNYCYISSFIMNIVPALVAKVKKIYITTPCKKLKYIFFLCNIFGIKKIYSLGGAQAIISFAIGTKITPKVDKIVGPGNSYVEEAKKIVFGKVGIDTIAGPTELLIITDGISKKKIIYDILAQLEHDKKSKVFLLSNNKKFIKNFKKYFEKKTKIIKNKIIEESKKNIKYYKMKNIKECIKLSNKIAPEHIQYIVKKDKHLNLLNNYGSIFIGYKTTEVLGDYSAGINHVLPTNSNSRFSSPLNVNDFYKMSNILKIKKKRNKKFIKKIIELPKIEGLLFHYLSLKIRK